MRTRSGWVHWYAQVRRWLETAGIYIVGTAMVADLMALFERDFEPQEAAFVAAEVEPPEETT